ncbi:MAG: hypothetical protein EAX96_13680 [Candidatus Lokiarchaeota archaeon]|nr:hypothetical protein [Candidatus Lokiarchaeota archaeon]
MDLLLDDEFIEKINAFSIRLHDAVKKGMHLDYCLGSKNLPNAIDFVVPKKLPKKGDKPRLGIMMEPHDNLYLFEKEGVIEEGYGQGTWKQIKQGNARVVRKSEHSWFINLGEAEFSFYIPPFLRKKKGNFLIKRI